MTADLRGTSPGSPALVRGPLDHLPHGPGRQAPAVRCAAFAHGLFVHALFDPDRFPPQRRTALIDRFLADLFPRS